MNPHTLYILKDSEAYLDDWLSVVGFGFHKEICTYFISYTFGIYNPAYLKELELAPIVLMLYSAESNEMFTKLYNYKSELVITAKTKSYRPNWKLQHQRHQTVKLLQITGS